MEFFLTRLAGSRPANYDKFVQRNFSEIKFKISYFTLCKKSSLENPLMAEFEYYRRKKLSYYSKRCWILYGNDNCFIKLKIQAAYRNIRFLLEFSCFHKNKNLAPMLNLSFNSLELISTLKQQLYVCNQKKLKLLFTKNPGYSTFKWKREKSYCHFFSGSFLSS